MSTPFCSGVNDAKKDLLIKPLANLPGAELEQAEDEPEELEPGIAKRSSGLPSSIPIERIVTGAEGLKLLQGQVRRVFILHHGLDTRLNQMILMN